MTGSAMPPGEWNLRFLSEMARMMAARPGTEFDPPGEVGYRVVELGMAGGHVRLVWSYPGVIDTNGDPVQAGRYMNLAELRAGFRPDDPEGVAEAMVLNDFYPANPPSGDRERSDGVRWLGPPPPGR